MEFINIGEEGVAAWNSLNVCKLVVPQKEACTKELIFLICTQKNRMNSEKLDNEGKRKAFDVNTRKKSGSKKPASFKKGSCNSTRYCCRQCLLKRPHLHFHLQLNNACFLILDSFD